MHTWSPPLAGETSGEDCSPHGSTVKTRKTTYYARKDEIESLHDQVRVLQTSLQQLGGGRDMEAAERLAKSVELRLLLDKTIQQQQLQLAGAQSLLSSYNSSLASPSQPSPGIPVPLKNYIHLPIEAVQREAVIAALRTPKLLAAFQFMAARTRFHDLRVAHHHSEQSRLLNGDIVATTFSVVQFDQGHSLRQVFEAYDFYASNQEISVSDNLDMLTICENDPGDVPRVGGQMRFVSSPLPGIEVDVNLVRFTTYVDATHDAPAYALGALDFVDQDDLYPYQPQRGRKEITSAWLMVEVPSSTGVRVVAMARWSHTRFSTPPGPLPRATEAAVASSITHWCDLMPKIMTEQLATQPPTP